MLLLVFIYFLPFAFSQNDYSRSMVQEKFSGFGTQWIPIVEYYNNKQVVQIGHFERPLEKNSDGRFINLLGIEAENSTSFTLYTRKNPEGVEVKSQEALINSTFNKNKPTKFVTHGWLSSGDADTCVRIKDGFLQKYDANVFIVDWYKISKDKFYLTPMYATTDVANYYGHFLNLLVHNFGVDPQSIHLVGHSLGAHVSGFAARLVKTGKIGRVTALDPALPGFVDIEMVKWGRLKMDDANFVDVIHTCAGFLGIKMPMGHADFYPNGGTVPQPGCDTILEGCSHGRSWMYFAESLVSPKPFMAFSCDSFDDFKNNLCENKTVPMGDATPLTARGKFYLETLAEPPYALGVPIGSPQNDL